MNGNWKANDWFVATLSAGMWISATVYIFEFHSDTVFGIWGGVCGTMLCAFKWLDIRDDKIKDANEH